jgi:EmrB/QacA subfamily drug resistance transporter
MNRSEHSHFNPWLALVVVCLGQFMVVLDATIVNVALPAIKADLHISAANLQWIVNAYTLFFGGFLLLGGRAADLFGRRNLFLAGVTLFSAALLVNGLASSEEMLIGARAAQGLGAALMSPAALAVITTTFAEGAERTKALSIWAGIASGGSAVGLLLGGVLTQTLSWEWIFFINVPIGLAILFAAVRLVPNSRVEGGSRHFDLVGAVSVTAGLLVLVYAIVKAQEWGWGSSSTLALAGLAAALLAAFIWIESRSPLPLVRLSLFRLRSLAAANGVFLIVIGGLFAMFFFASLYLQNILGFSALTTGFAFLPVTVGIAMGAVAAQQLVPKIGVRPVMLTGLSVAAVGLTTLGVTTEVDGTYLGVLSGLLPMSLGMGATFVSLTLVATTNVEEKDAGLASGIFNTSQQVGGALGLAILSTLANDRTSSVLSGLTGQPTPGEVQSALVDGYQLAFFAAAALLAVGAVLLGVLLKQRDVARIDAGDAIPVPA